MYIKEKYSSALAKIITNFDQVYLDTCSLMEEGFPEFMDYLDGSRDYWQKENIEIIVLGSVMFELENHIANKENINVAIEAKRAQKIIKHASSRLGHRMLTIAESDAKFADQEISSVVISNRTDKKILIITQDKKLATDLRKFNSLGSQRGKEVQIYRITQEGLLEPTPNETYTPQKQRRNKPIDTAKPAKTETKQNKQQTNDDISLIVKNDAIIASNLNNQNFPSDKKVVLINEQIKRIENVENKTKTKIDAELKFSVADLKNELVKYQKTKPEEPKKQDKPKAESYYTISQTIFDGAVKTANHFSIMVRGDGVPYVKQVHGEFDLTNGKLLELIENAKKDKNGVLSFSLGGLKWTAAKTDNKYKVTLSKGATKQPAEPAPATSKATPKEVAKTKQDKEQQKLKEQTPKKPSEPKMPAKQGDNDAKSANSKFLDEALKSEQRLRANITNPNYPDEKKINDIDAHIKLLKKIPKVNRKGLKLDTPELNKTKTELLAKAKKLEPEPPAAS